MKGVNIILASDSHFLMTLLRKIMERSETLEIIEEYQTVKGLKDDRSPGSGDWIVLAFNKDEGQIQNLRDYLNQEKKTRTRLLDFEAERDSVDIYEQNQSGKTLDVISLDELFEILNEK